MLSTTELYSQDEEFKSYVDKFALDHKDRGRALTTSEALETAIVAEYGLCLQIRKKDISKN